jgi:pimeloyl-ACP methyl ester carboxylesterase
MILDSGRRLAVHVRPARAGASFNGTGRSPQDSVVVLCHSAPGAGIFDPDPAQTRARNVTLLSVDRPGYGGSDPVASGEWATVASAADDLAAVLDSLDLRRVGVAGWSAGGRVALALAARRPDLVDRVAVIGTPAPDEEVDWIAPAERHELEQLREVGPDEAHTRLADRFGALIPEDPFSDDALWLLAAGPADEPALRTEGVRIRLGQMLRAAFARGPRGLAADIAGYCLQPWGFEPGDVEAKTLLLYGLRDPIAGPRHGRWWQTRLSAARLEVAPGAGHLLVIPTWPQVLAHVAPRRRALYSVDGSWTGTGDVDVEEYSAA